MSRVFTQIIAVVSLGLTINVYAEKEVFYTDGNITIYTDNTVVYTGKKEVPVFEPSSTWVEEDYFTQQEKYCEVDSVHKDKLKAFLNSIQKK
ncbi:hypothetical protein [Candidatus Thioglobus sp.]|uniref:hypothetical protein n=1 Tax=Candidatus Thioglobus sp. TaxID=2026721 RepID=UPI00260A1D0B|nr:hypothetical protein [Candidatus Thioglobus sp.]MDG2395578.1 hypothetical protein [Candidatus Thioglobus sp.]